MNAVRNVRKREIRSYSNGRFSRATWDDVSDDANIEVVGHNMLACFVSRYFSCFHKTRTLDVEYSDLPTTGVSLNRLLCHFLPLDR